MITPEEIKKKSLRKYADFLRAVIARESFFPLSIPGKKGSANQPLEVLFPSLKLLLEGGKDKTGFGYEVSLKTVNTRHAGAISMPDDIYFDNIEDYLKYIEKDAEFSRFQKVIVPSLKALPALKTWIEKLPLQAIKHLDIWADLIKVCQYFTENSQPDAYIRNLPIDVEPTFIKAHQGVLTDLLNVILPRQAKIDSPIFEERFALRFDAPTVRMRLLDAGLIKNSPDFVQDISLPISQFQQLQISAENVFLIEDKDCFLAFPNHTKSVAIWSGTHSLRSLQKLTFLHSKQVFFWGNITAASFKKLSQIRTSFPQTQSLLMNEKTFTVFGKRATRCTTDFPHLTNLNAEERACYVALQNAVGENYLEQKEISQKYLKEGMKF
ncbi:MAG: hypothetical protein ACI85O_000359 [Saprospiraceae bacterium]|jgi:hypothetical protein